MKRGIFTGIFLCSLFFVVGGDARSQAATENPVWTLEFIRVKAENFGLTMGYLDDHWMRVRAEAKRRGEVLEYYRIQNATLTNPGHTERDSSSIVLLTKYKNMAAFMDRTSMRDQIATTPAFALNGVVRLQSLRELAETLTTQVFLEEPDANTGLKLLSKQ